MNSLKKVVLTKIIKLKIDSAASAGDQEKYTK